MSAALQQKRVRTQMRAPAFGNEIRRVAVLRLDRRLASKGDIL
jgi:hypothetical protein